MKNNTQVRTLQIRKAQKITGAYQWGGKNANTELIFLGKAFHTIQ